MSFRVRPELKNAMDKAADESGRSVAQEIEIRLETTFRDQDRLFEGLAAVRWSRELAATVILIGDAMHRASRARPFRLLLGDSLVGHHHAPWYYDHMMKAAQH